MKCTGWEGLKRIKKKRRKTFKKTNNDISPSKYLSYFPFYRNSKAKIPIQF